MCVCMCLSICRLCGVVLLANFLLLVGYSYLKQATGKIVSSILNLQWDPTLSRIRSKFRCVRWRPINILPGIRTYFYAHSNNNNAFPSCISFMLRIEMVAYHSANPLRYNTISEIIPQSIIAPGSMQNIYVSLPTVHVKNKSPQHAFAAGVLLV